MPPIRNYKDHEWTNFETHTMLCLITKGVHLEGYGKVKKSEDPNTAKRNAYLTFATTLNDALHGTNYEHDIHKKEVTRMLDHLVLKHKAIVGKGGLAERQYGGRVTRVLRLAWQRSLGQNAETGKNYIGVPSPLDFDGSISEWNQWRRKAVENKRRAKLGLAPLEGVNAERELAEKIEKQNQGGRPRDARGGQNLKLPARKWRGQQQNTLSNECVIDEADQGDVPTTASDKPVQTKLGSFNVLPANVPSAGKFQWANPEARQQAFLGGLRGAAAIAAFQSVGGESRGSGDHHGQGNSSPSRSTRESYVPPINSYSSGSGHQPGSGMSAHAQGTSGFAPGLTHDYSSSDGIDTSINTPIKSNGNHPRLQDSGEMTPLDLNVGHADTLAKGLGSVAPSNEVAAEQVSSTEVAGEGGEVEMGGLEEGQIWADLDSARDFAY